MGHESVEEGIDPRIGVHDEESNGSKNGTKCASAAVAGRVVLPHFPSMKW